MADPLSIAASAISVVGAAKTVSKTLSTVIKLGKLDVPDELMTLVNEVSDFRLVVDQVCQIVYYDRPDSVQPNYPQIGKALRDLESRLSDVQALIAHVSDGHVSRGQKKFKLKLKWLREKPKILAALQQVRDCRLLLLTSIVNPQVRSLLTVELIEAPSNRLENLPGLEVEQTLDPAMEKQTAPAQQINSIHLEQEEQVVPGHLNSIHQKVDRILHSQEPTVALRSGGQICSCACHGAWQFRTPNALRQVIGNLSGSISAYWRPCDISACIREKLSELHLVYQCPNWLFQRQLYFHATFRYATSVFNSATFRISRILSTNDPVLYCISEGDTRGVSALFNGGKVSPLDADGYGDTLLHIAVREDQPAVCKLLVACGADPYAPNGQNRTPSDLAWDRIISSLASTEMIEVFHPFESSLNRRKFSKLHLVVLGLAESDLETLLSLDELDINCLDNDGRSALYWAIRRGDLTAAKLLLRFGADINAGNVPLAWTCRELFSDVEALQLLLEHGADPDGHDNDGHTAMHTCGLYGRDSRFLDVLINHGARPNTPYRGLFSSYQGFTAISFAALYGHAQTVYDLITYGADPNVQDSQGRSPLHHTAECKVRGRQRVQIMETLLLHGANPFLRDHRQLTPANIAILQDDLSCFSLMRESGAPFVFPQWMDYPENGYCQLNGPMEYRRLDIVSYLLPHVNIRDRSPTTGETVLHLLAKYGNHRMLTIFEEAIGLNRLQVDSRDDQGLDATMCANEEMRQIHKRFATFLRQHEISPTSVYRAPRIDLPSHIYPGSDSDDFMEVFWDAEEYGEETPWNPTISTLGSTRSSSTRTRTKTVLDKPQPPTYLDATAPATDSVELCAVRSERDQDTAMAVHAEVNQNYLDSVDEAIELEYDIDNELNLMRWHSLSTHKTPLPDGTDSGYESEASERELDDMVEVFEGLTIPTRRRKPDESAQQSRNVDTVQEKDKDDGLLLRATTAGYESQIHGMIVIFSILASVLALATWCSASVKRASLLFEHACRVHLRPKLAPGHKRITWNCHCGQELYGDFPNDNPEALQALSETLSSSSNSPDSNGSLPPAPRPPPRSFHPNGKGRSDTGNASSSTSSTNTSIPYTSEGPIIPRFLELCINTGKSCQSLGEIDVTRIDTDAKLFAWVRKKYRDVRGFRIKKHFLVKPVAMRFVHFGFETKKKKIHIFKEHSYPAREDVSARTWHYDPCPPEPPPPMPSSAFIHYLRHYDEDPASVGECIWLGRLPKKLYEPLLRCSDPLACAWGLHIIEGPDKVKILWFVICTLVICLGPVVAYIVLKKDIQGATGIGGLYVAVLTLLWMVMKVVEHGED